MRMLLGVLLLIIGVFFSSGCDAKSSQESASQAQRDRDEQIIIDDAHLLYGDEKLMKMYREYNDALLKRFDVDFRVMTVSNDENIDLLSHKKFTELQKESRSTSGKALLLVINTRQDKVRLEVSTGLEPIYTDAFVSYIERKGFVPYFREGKIADGVYMATELIRDRAFEAESGKEWMPPMQSKSIGGGAKTKAYIGVTDPEAKKGVDVVAQHGNDPKAVLQQYMKALKAHNTNPNLDIYTNATKKFFRQWTVTEINQDHELHNLAPCLALHKTLYDQDSSHALLAVRPYDKNRKCSPYLFKKEEGKWKLDIATMADTLRFNADMQWHFDLSKRLEGEGVYYAFGFDGYGFDSNGYPYVRTYPIKDKDQMRWGFTCNGWYTPEDQERVKQDPERYTRCWIALAHTGMPARVRLGLDVYDYIYAVGEGSERIDNVSYNDFMSYMKQVPSGSMAVVEVKHYDPDTKQTTDVVRRGIAP